MILSYFWHIILRNWTLFIFFLYLKHKCFSIICWQKYLLWITCLPASLPAIQVMLVFPLFKLPVQFSHSVMFNFLQPHGLQHTRLPCLSPTPGVCSNSCPLTHDGIQPSHPLSSPSPPEFNLSQYQGLFPMSQFFTFGGQSNEVSASVLPMNIQDWFALGLTGLISLQPKGLSRVFSNTTVQESILQCSVFFIVQLWYQYMTTGKTITSTTGTFVRK